MIRRKPYLIKLGRKARVKARRQYSQAPVVDFMGHEIKPDCVLCYPVRRGSSLWMNKITVTQVRPDQVKGYNPTGRAVTLKNLKNTVIGAYGS